MTAKTMSFLSSASSNFKGEKKALCIGACKLNVFYRVWLYVQSIQSLSMEYPSILLSKLTIIMHFGFIRKKSNILEI